MNSTAGLRIELGEVATSKCTCCGRNAETVHGYLYDDEGETAVYFAEYTHGHPQRRAKMVLSPEGWGEGKEPEDRRAIPVEAAFEADGGIEISFPAPKDSPWRGEEYLGKMIDPEKLSVQEREMFRQLVLAAVENDPRIAVYRKNG